jgi:hypothetical protein
MSPAPAGTSRYTAGPSFKLRCADVHDVPCNASWSSSNPDDLVYLAQRHGASAHGFTPGWYSPSRLTLMRAAVTS